MSWLSENKFLAGFGAVMLAGVGTLGWLTWSAMGKYDTSLTAYDEAATKLKGLQEEKPALKDGHLKELLSQKAEHNTKIGALLDILKKRVLPMPAAEVDPAQFQDRLKVSVGQFSGKAAQSKIELPKGGFYLGFESYQKSPPTKQAATALSRQLQAVELLMEVLNQSAIQSGGFEITEFRRGNVPEEVPAKPAENAKPSGSDKAAAAEQSPIKRQSLHLKLKSSDETLRQILNGLANHRQQIFVIRNASIQNTQMDSPPRVLASSLPPIAPLAPGPPGPPAGPGTPPGPFAPPDPVTTPAPAPAPEAGLSYVFGREQVISEIHIEVLGIEEPKPKPDKKTKEK